MKNRTGQRLLAFVSLTILITIGLQLHWNAKTFRENRRQLRNEIQIALDAAVENYYADNAKRRIAHFATDSLKPDALSVALADSNTTFSYHHSGNEKRIMEQIGTLSDSPRKVSISIIRTGKPIDISTPANAPDITMLTDRLLASLLRDSIRLPQLDTLVARELARKQIGLDYGLAYRTGAGTTQRWFKTSRNLTQAMQAKSTYLPPASHLTLHFTDPSLLALQRSSAEIVLSLLLSLSVVGCLLYLLRVINRQKKIDEIRNDLIGNITHEFKTPITTIGTAIEGIRNFNSANDPEKTKKYLDISEHQLGKLGVMVERLLETASLDTDNLPLDKKPADLSQLLAHVVEKFRLGTPKTIMLDANAELFADVDAFHFENVLANLLDNAVKYGGQTIAVQLSQTNAQTEITIRDDGHIPASARAQLFEKFYRIPHGNVHDVKGFGIGLYYSRKIIEKHGGSLVLLPGDPTTFKITL